MSKPFDIEQPAELLAYLRSAGRIGRDETPRVSVLRGGVSNRTVLVERKNGVAFVLKQALEKLRVQADWFSDPRRIHRESLGLQWLEKLAPPGTITPLLFEDPAHHLLAMQAVPQPHENWKVRLLAQGPNSEHVRQFGVLLGTIHQGSIQRRDELQREFDDRDFFESLRLEPYYRYTTAQIPQTKGFFAGLITDTLATRLALVHGDYSPKNILIHQDQLVLLDHEVIHLGDPAFDLGFALTHLLSKAHHLPGMRQRFANAAMLFWDVYRRAAEEIARAPAFEDRVVRHTLGCLLARVDGRSPLEYLTAAEQTRQREVVLAQIAKEPASVPALIDSFIRLLG